jgi:4-hydroxy-3-polyprenylbenzoate decarboxylase
MAYRCTRDALLDLERHGMLRRIAEPVNPKLEMAAIHRRVFRAGGPALWFERVEGSPFPAASNIFGTMERCRFLFRDTLPAVQKLVALKGDPAAALKDPLSVPGTALNALKALPRKVRSGPVCAATCAVSDLPQIVSSPEDGGPFVTLPQVYTESPDKAGPMGANLGMYRIQLGGNAYEADREIGLHYQIHRGIGVHQQGWQDRGEAMKVSVFVGGPPAHTLAAVMPLPEGLSELTFGGVLGGRRWRYAYRDGFALSTDADFVITGTIVPGLLKPEGPFGDHLGYYSLSHDFPVLRVDRVWHRKDAIWPFTVVGRPPQEDSAFGELIHEMTGQAVRDELPGVQGVHAVDASGVHPLLFAVGSERYTPYAKTDAGAERPLEMLTQAHHILGTGQLSLAKYLFMAADRDRPPALHDEGAFVQHCLERLDLTRDLHFQTQTSIDTLDYSGTGLNTGSKLVLAALGAPRRRLLERLPEEAGLPPLPTDGLAGRYAMAMPGVLCASGAPFRDYPQAEEELARWAAALAQHPACGSLHAAALDFASGAAPDSASGESAASAAAPIASTGSKARGTEAGKIPLIVLCDDAAFAAASLENWLWVTFTRSNPSHDVYGVQAFSAHKHWGCRGAMIIDARIKPFHAPPVEDDPDVERGIDRFFAKGGALEGLE